MQPLLLRSAGVVGLAGAIVAVISSDAFFARPDGPGRQAEPVAERVLSAGDPAAARLASSMSAAEPTAGSPIEDSETERAVRLAAARRAGAGPASPDPDAPGAPALPALPADTASPAIPDLPAPPPADATASIMPATPPSLPAVAPQVVNPPPPTPSAVQVAAEPNEAAAPGSGSPWPENAVKCPRDWVAVEASDPSSGAPSECSENVAALPDLGTSPVVDPAVHEALAERASEVALLIVPRIPKARPNPPRTRSRARASGKLGPPPKCGNKYPRWRYVNKVPTWYCK